MRQHLAVVLGMRLVVTRRKRIRELVTPSTRFHTSSPNC